jgi:hypothetical protein
VIGQLIIHALTNYCIHSEQNYNTQTYNNDNGINRIVENVLKDLQDTLSTAVNIASSFQTSDTNSQFNGSGSIQPEFTHTAATADNNYFESASLNISHNSIPQRTNFGILGDLPPFQHIPDMHPRAVSAPLEEDEFTKAFKLHKSTNETMKNQPKRKPKKKRKNAKKVFPPPPPSMPPSIPPTVSPPSIPYEVPQEQQLVKPQEHNTPLGAPSTATMSHDSVHSTPIEYESAIHNPAQFQQQNESFTNTFEPEARPVQKRQFVTPDYGNQPRNFKKQQKRRHPNQIQNHNRFGTPYYPSPSPIHSGRTPETPDSANRSLLIRFESSDEDESDTEWNDYDYNEYNERKRMHNPHHDGYNKRPRTDSLDIMSPPTKRRRVTLNNFQLVDQRIISDLESEVAQKEKELETMKEDMDGKETSLNQTMEQMYGNEEKRISLEARKKLLQQQLKAVGEQIEVCIKDNETFRRKITLQENMVHKKKEQRKRALIEYKDLKLELYEVQLHNTIINESEKGLDAISPTFTSKLETILPITLPPTPTLTMVPQAKNLHRPDNRIPVPAQQISPLQKQQQQQNEQKRKIFEQNQERLRQLEAAMNQSKQQQALMKKKMGLEDEFISLTDDGSLKTPLHSKVEKKKQHLPTEDIFEELKYLNIAAPSVEQSDSIFKKDPVVVFMRECGGRLLFSPNSERESLFRSTKGNIQYTTGEATQQSGNETFTSFEKYESCLNVFRSYRSDPLFAATSKGTPSSSAGPSHIDPNRFLCQSITKTQCYDPHCKYQHTEDFEQAMDQNKSTTSYGKINAVLKRAHERTNYKNSVYHPRPDLSVLETNKFDTDIKHIIRSQSQAENSRYYNKLSVQDYESHLKQFPDDVAYWIRYSMKTIAESSPTYSEGIKTALIVLSQGLERNPTSTDLWFVYLELYTSELNTLANEQELQDLFVAAIQKIGHSILLWFKIIAHHKQLDRKLECIDEAISYFKTNAGSMAKAEASRSITVLLLEKTRVLCCAGQYETAIKVITSMYQMPIISLDDDEYVEFELESDLSSILLPLHRCNLWLAAIVVRWKNQFPYAEHFAGSSLLAFVDKPMIINFTFDISEPVRSEIFKLFDMGLQLFPHDTARDILPFQLNLQYFQFLYDKRKAETQFADRMQEVTQVDEKPNKKTPEMVCSYLLFLHRTFKDDAKQILSSFYSSASSKSMNSDPYVWYKALLFYMEIGDIVNAVQTIWNSLRSYHHIADTINKSHEEKIEECLTLLQNVLDYRCVGNFTNLRGNLQYNIFVWLVYIAMETIKNPAKKDIAALFEDSLQIMNSKNDKLKILEEYAEFMLIAGDKRDYERVVNMFVNTAKDVIHPFISLTVAIIPDSPLLKALIDKQIVKVL